jgi:hypothetical protein
MIIKLQQVDLLLRLEVKNLIEKLIRYSYFVYYIIYKINNLKVLFLPVGFACSPPLLFALLFSPVVALERISWGLVGVGTKASLREAYEGLDGVGTKPPLCKAIEGEILVA